MYENNPINTTRGDESFIAPFKLLERQTSLTSFLKARMLEKQI